MKILVKAIRWTSLVSLPAMLLTLTIPSSPAVAGSIGSCASSLIGNGASKEAAAAACSDALEPDELSACVGNIASLTKIKAEDALEACYRVRRPQELASCVTDLSANVDQEKSTMALDNCRRSLLPEHYAECTLDLQSVAQVPSTEAMESCITAEYFPSEVAPPEPMNK
jgi:hypothetical protein